MSTNPCFSLLMFNRDDEPDESQIRARFQRFRQQYLALHPDLRRLSGSELKFSTRIRADGLHFQVYLAPNHSQGELPLRSARRGFQSIDSYAADAAAFRRSIDELPQVVLEAFNPEITAAQLRTDYSSRHIAVRAISRSSGRTLLDDLFFGDVIHLGPTMAKGTHAELTLRVDRYERRRARVQIIDGIYPAVDLTQSVKLERKVPLLLKAFDDDRITHAALVKCIDQDSLIKLPVNIAWRSTDGQIDFLECSSL
jgi:hypothetical protein